MIHARAPAKLILTGEHAVIYGAPAVVAAVQRYVDVYFTPQPQLLGLQTFLHQLGQEGVHYPLNRLKRFKAKLDQHFDEFLRGQRPVQQILHRPDDLLAYTLATVTQHLPPLRGRLQTQSQLPLGAGMGSSAAVIAATLLIDEALSQQKRSLEERFQQVRFCERLQHGKGSALDAAAVVYGGLHLFQNDVLEALPQAWMDKSAWYYLQQGVPQSSTGECVAAVRQKYGHDKALWQEFSAVSQAFVEALRTGNCPKASIQHNQYLLQKIGVVPQCSQRLIQQLSASGTAVKISGAGSIRGDTAGMMLLYQPDAALMDDLKKRFPQYKIQALKIAAQGAMLLPEALP